MLCESRKYELDCNVKHTEYETVKFSSLLRMTKTLLMASHENYNLGAREGFVMLLTSKLITCFIDGFTLRMKSKSIACLLNEREHIYWIWDLEDEVHLV